MNVHLFARCTHPGLREGIGGCLHKRLQRAVKTPVGKSAPIKVEVGSLGQAAACLLVYKMTIILVSKTGQVKKTKHVEVNEISRKKYPYWIKA